MDHPHVNPYVGEEIVLPRGSIFPDIDQHVGVMGLIRRIQAHLADPKRTTTLCLAGAGYAGTGKTAILQVLLRRLAWEDLIPYVQVSAPTGKAVDRLRSVLGGDPLNRAGGPGSYMDVVRDLSTIHRRIYGGPTEQGVCPDCGKLSRELVDLPEWADARECPWCKASVPLATDIKTQLIWSPPTIEENAGIGQTILIVDEGSMVNRNVHNDMVKALRGGVLIYCWDKAQLPPVITQEEVAAGIDPKDPWGPTAPEVEEVFVLTRIRRTADGSPINLLANAVREGRIVTPPAQVNPPLSPSPHIRVQLWTDVSAPVRWLVEQRRLHGSNATLICYTNKTRQELNQLARDALGLRERALRTGVPIVEGDLIVARQNHRGGAYFKGTIYGVKDAVRHRFRTYNRIDARGRLMDEGEPVHLLEVFHERGLVYLHQECIGVTEVIQRDKLRDVWRTAKLVARWYHDTHHEPIPPGQLQMVLEGFDAANPDDIGLFDYAQAITGHASQGSQWHSVGGVWEGACWGMWHKERAEAIRWLYTVMTRATTDLALFSFSKRQPT